MTFTCCGARKIRIQSNPIETEAQKTLQGVVLAFSCVKRTLAKTVSHPMPSHRKMEGFTLVVKRGRRRGGQRIHGHERPFLTTLEALEPVVGKEAAQPDRRPAVGESVSTAAVPGRGSFPLVRFGKLVRKGFL
ncbi:hypothetical protein E2C01_069015 [Portunus trituberculatus]|uniref:Uncharacterized protein n=1 Tax=Portunus trituberculatus TaxID=210409 RepID=A0A5B7HY38_PORTR|nr:hypothetical protein [Portunus trituberculatus]